MPSLDTSLAFFSIAVLLALSPGPDNLFVLMQSATGGRRAGWAVVAGLMLGVLLQTLAVALGLAALFAASATAFTVLKLAGAVYLLYLAWGAWRAPATLAAGGGASHAQPPAWSRLMLRGVVMNLSNPKVVLFFLALLPQFVDPRRGGEGWQIAQLGALFTLVALVVFSGIGWFSGHVGERLKRNPSLGRWLDGVAGTVFVGLGIRLLVAR